jgi:hypothetical protein
LNKTFLGAVILFAVAIGFLSYANAEADNSTKNVFEGVEPECREIHTAKTINGTVYENHLLDCKWFAQEMASAKQNLTSSEQEALDELVEKRKSGESEVTIDLSYLKEPSPLPKVVSDKIPESCTRTNPSPSDIEECNIDTKMGFCERGIQSTSPIQQYEYFAVTEYNPRDDLQIDLQQQTSVVKKLKDYEECRAELQLIIDLNKTHYVGISKQIAKGEYNPYHRDFVTTDLIFPSQEKVDEGRLVSESLKAENRLCKMPYTDKFLKENGCDLSYKYEGTYKNNTGLTEFEKRLINDSPLTEWYKYKEADQAGEKYYPKWIKKHSLTITSMGSLNEKTTWEIVTQNKKD